jgi:CubicO group peptidase (beta-lactamase class C family)
MDHMKVIPSDYDFGSMHAAMQRYVDTNILAGVSCAVLVGRDLVDVNCAGWAIKEDKTPLGVDHIFRVYSNTKLVTACAALLLFEEGRFQLDDPIERFIPQLSNRQVLRPSARTLTDVEPARSSITIRHLLSHTSGLSYGLLDPGTMMFNAYTERKVLDQSATLANMIDRLADLPLLFHPGAGWEYSVASDVMARCIEVVSGQAFDVFIQSRILDPLGMVDTGFAVPASKRHRFAALHAAASLMNPMQPGLKRIDDASPQAYGFFPPARWLSGGAGLVSTLHDMVALLRSLRPGGPTLLKPETIALMMTNQLPDGAWIRFPGVGSLQGKGFGLAGAVTVAPSARTPKASPGDFTWGGIAGTQWWISPKNDCAVLLMTQRFPALLHPYILEIIDLVRQAVTR